jgi:glutathione S-transferase
LITACRGRPLMRRMHKPDPKLAPHEQDKRSVIAINTANWDTWLQGSHEGAQALIRLTRSKTTRQAGTTRPDRRGCQ